MSRAAISARWATPMSTTMVPPTAASASQLVSRFDSKRLWPVTTVNDVEQPRWVHRDAGVGGHGDGRGDPGHDLEGDAGRRQGHGLLAAPPEDEGVAALQPDDGVPGPAALDEEGVDRRPGATGPPGDLPTSTISAPGGARSSSDGFGQPVMDDHVGPAHAPRPRAR